jgi:nucleotide-binding universal stress UspA family protein
MIMRSIAHATDFSPASAQAFEHALRLALEFRCPLDLLHVRKPEDDDAWSSFPHVRETLARWKLLPANASHAEVEGRLGIPVQKVEIRHRNAIDGLVRYFTTHRPDLVVLATHGSEGRNHWLSGSISESVARHTHLPTLFFAPNVRPFVDIVTGQLRLTKVVVAVARAPSPRQALSNLSRLFANLTFAQHVVHIGDTAPWLHDPSGALLNVHLMQGPVVETILQAADAFDANLLAMPTAGHNGFLDVLRGSTTERVLHAAKCPLLALPA